MSHSSETAGSHKNVADRGGVVYSGNFTGPIATATGDKGNAVSVSFDAQDQLIEDLRNRLAEARRLLSEQQDPSTAVTRLTAIKEIDALGAELSDHRADRDAGRLRSKINDVISALTPVTGIIGGVAAVLEILKDLNAIT